MRLEKGGVTEGAVAADREQGGPPPGELVGDLSQAGELGRSDAPEVVAVEAEDDVPPPELPEPHRAARGAGQLEIRRGLSPPERRHDAAPAPAMRGILVDSARGVKHFRPVVGGPRCIVGGMRGFESAPPDVQALLPLKISELGLKIEGSPVERHVARVNRELERKGLRHFRPRCYLTVAEAPFM